MPRMFLREIRIVGTTMGTREEFAALLEHARLCLRPTMAAQFPLSEVARACKFMESPQGMGRIVLELSAGDVA